MLFIYLGDLSSDREDTKTLGFKTSGETNYLHWFDGIYSRTSVHLVYIVYMHSVNMRDAFMPVLDQALASCSISILQ